MKYTPEALDDLDRLLDYIAERNPQGEERVRERIQICLKLIENYPQIGQATPRKAIRRMVISPYPYLIFYRYQGDDIIILSFRHGARKPPL